MVVEFWKFRTRMTRALLNLTPRRAVQCQRDISTLCSMNYIRKISRRWRRYVDIRNSSMRSRNSSNAETENPRSEYASHAARDRSGVV